MYSNCCYSCSFEAEIIKNGQLSHKMYCNNILIFQESSTILNASTKKSGNLLNAPRRLVINLKIIISLSFHYSTFKNHINVFIFLFQD